ncbi:MAG: sialate O-acetylesterase [Verrucomicrobiota bacterium]
MKVPGLFFTLVVALVSTAWAELKLPAVIGDHMVLQQKQSNPIWGWDEPGTRITVTFAGQKRTAVAGADGKWTVKLDPLPASAEARELQISGSSERKIADVLVGEVWVCAGQSNMAWSLNRTNTGDIESAATNLPHLRLISVPAKGTQELQNDFVGKWEAANPTSVKTFSAVGFFFGRYLQQTLGVPVGLINNAWGGTSAEAWIRRESLDRNPRFKLLMEATAKREAEEKTEAGPARFAAAMAKWKEDSKKAKAEGKASPSTPLPWLTGKIRPSNAFAGVLHPTLGYGIKGVIWYQGESNATRAHEYADLFPFLITEWRREWGQGDFPFYWAQLANFRPREAEPGDAEWAELREAQTKAQRLPNTGQAVIIDLGEGRDVHPRNKYDVASRLVRWTLVKDYGMKLPYRSPEYKALRIEGAKAVVTIDCFGSRLRAFDTEEPLGFTVCGADKVWRWAKGRVVVGRNEVEVWSEQVPAPIAVRYAWADNPVCNLYSADGLPVTPFRTDDFKMVTEGRLP